MLSKLFSSTIAKALSGIAVVLLALLAVQSYRLNRAQDRIETLTAQLALTKLAIARITEEGAARTERAKRSLEAAKRDAKPLQRDIERILAEVPDGTCDTPASILEADGL